MSSKHLKEVRWRDLPSLALSALFRGPQAQGAAVHVLPEEEDPERVQRDNLWGLQGLALIGLGFILQAGVTIFTLLHPS